VSADERQRVLIVGVPRSGTTWVANILVAASGAGYVEEPDNHFRFASAFAAKLELGRREYPMLEPHEHGAETVPYAQLWSRAFSPRRAGRRQRIRQRVGDRLVSIAGPPQVSKALAAPGSESSALLRVAKELAVPHGPDGDAHGLVVKTVYGPLAAEWITSVGAVDAVVVVVRNPLNVVSSWLGLGWLDRDTRDPVSALAPAAVEVLGARFGMPPSSRLGQAAWLVGVQSSVLEEAVQRNPAWHRVVHEEACVDAPAVLSRIALRAGLRWSRRGDEMLAAENREGSGYDVTRVAAELPEAWRSRLDRDQEHEIRHVIDALPPGPST